jgi:hypothetical protein
VIPEVLIFDLEKIRQLNFRKMSYRRLINIDSGFYFNYEEMHFYIIIDHYYYYRRRRRRRRRRLMLAQYLNFTFSATTYLITDYT